MGLAKDIIKDNKKYPKRVWILGICILIVWLIFLFRFLFSLWWIWASIWIIVFIILAVILYITIDE